MEGEYMWMMPTRRLQQDGARPPAGEQSMSVINMDKRPDTVLIALVVAVPTVLIMLVLLLAFLLWRQCRRTRTLAGAVRPPGIGPQTTLLVTDIMNSTVLWECLPAYVMDKSVRLHHACLRKLLRTFNGYESATEGDCFILAFHAPADAARFALTAQMELMDQQWPNELLEHPDACEVWVSCPPAKRSPFGEPFGAVRQMHGNHHHHNGHHSNHSYNTHSGAYQQSKAVYERQQGDDRDHHEQLPTAINHHQHNGSNGFGGGGSGGGAAAAATAAAGVSAVASGGSGSDLYSNKRGAGGSGTAASPFVAISGNSRHLAMSLAATAAAQPSRLSYIACPIRGSADNISGSGGAACSSGGASPRGSSRALCKGTSVSWRLPTCRTIGGGGAPADVISMGGGINVGMGSACRTDNENALQLVTIKQRERLTSRSANTMMPTAAATASMVAAGLRMSYSGGSAATSTTPTPAATSRYGSYDNAIHDCGPAAAAQMDPAATTGLVGASSGGSCVSRRGAIVGVGSSIGGSGGGVGGRPAVQASCSCAPGSVSCPGTLRGASCQRSTGHASSSSNTNDKSAAQNYGKHKSSDFNIGLPDSRRGCKDHISEGGRGNDQHSNHNNGDCGLGGDGHGSSMGGSEDLRTGPSLSGCGSCYSLSGGIAGAVDSDIACGVNAQQMGTTHAEYGPDADGNMNTIHVDGGGCDRNSSLRAPAEDHLHGIRRSSKSCSGDGGSSSGGAFRELLAAALADAEIASCTAAAEAAATSTAGCRTDRGKDGIKADPHSARTAVPVGESCRQKVGDADVAGGDNPNQHGCGSSTRSASANDRGSNGSSCLGQEHAASSTVKTKATSDAALWVSVVPPVVPPAAADAAAATDGHGSSAAAAAVADDAAAKRRSRKPADRGLRRQSCCLKELGTAVGEQGDQGNADKDNEEQQQHSMAPASRHCFLTDCQQQPPHQQQHQQHQRLPLTSSQAATGGTSSPSMFRGSSGRSGRGSSGVGAGEIGRCGGGSTGGGGGGGGRGNAGGSNSSTGNSTAWFRPSLERDSPPQQQPDRTSVQSTNCDGRDTFCRYSSLSVWISQPSCTAGGGGGGDASGAGAAAHLLKGTSSSRALRPTLAAAAVSTCRTGSSVRAAPPAAPPLGALLETIGSPGGLGTPSSSSSLSPPAATTVLPPAGSTEGGRQYGGGASGAVAGGRHAGNSVGCDGGDGSEGGGDCSSSKLFYTPPRDLALMLTDAGVVLGSSSGGGGAHRCYHDLHGDAGGSSGSGGDDGNEGGSVYADACSGIPPLSCTATVPEAPPTHQCCHSAMEPPSAAAAVAAAAAAAAAGQAAATTTTAAAAVAAAAAGSAAINCYPPVAPPATTIHLRIVSSAPAGTPNTRSQPCSAAAAADRGADSRVLDADNAMPATAASASASYAPSLSCGAVSSATAATVNRPPLAPNSLGSCSSCPAEITASSGFTAPPPTSSIPTTSEAGLVLTTSAPPGFANFPPTATSTTLTESVQRLATRHGPHPHQHAPVVVRMPSPKQGLLRQVSTKLLMERMSRDLGGGAPAGADRCCDGDGDNSTSSASSSHGCIVGGAAASVGSSGNGSGGDSGSCSGGGAERGRRGDGITSRSKALLAACKLAAALVTGQSVTQQDLDDAGFGASRGFKAAVTVEGQPPRHSSSRSGGSWNGASRSSSKRRGDEHRADGGGGGGGGGAREDSSTGSSREGDGTSSSDGRGSYDGVGRHAGVRTFYRGAAADGDSRAHDEFSSSSSSSSCSSSSCRNVARTDAASNAVADTSGAAGTLRPTTGATEFSPVHIRKSLSLSVSAVREAVAREALDRAASFNTTTTTTAAARHVASRTITSSSRPSPNVQQQHARTNIPPLSYNAMFRKPSDKALQYMEDPGNNNNNSIALPRSYSRNRGGHGFRAVSRSHSGGLGGGLVTNPGLLSIITEGASSTGMAAAAAAPASVTAPSLSLAPLPSPQPYHRHHYQQQQQQQRSTGSHVPPASAPLFRCTTVPHGGGGCGVSEDRGGQRSSGGGPAGVPGSIHNSGTVLNLPMTSTEALAGLGPVHELLHQLTWREFLRDLFPIITTSISPGGADNNEPGAAGSGSQGGDGGLTGYTSASEAGGGGSNAGGGYSGYGNAYGGAGALYGDASVHGASNVYGNVGSPMYGGDVSVRAGGMYGGGSDISLRGGRIYGGDMSIRSGAMFGGGDFPVRDGRVYGADISVRGGGMYGGSDTSGRDVGGRTYGGGSISLRGGAVYGNDASARGGGVYGGGDASVRAGMLGGASIRARAAFGGFPPGGGGGSMYGDVSVRGGNQNGGMYGAFTGYNAYGEASVRGGGAYGDYSVRGGGGYGSTTSGAGGGGGGDMSVRAGFLRGRTARFLHNAAGACASGGNEGSSRALAFRGLRVRMGMHTGISNPSDCAFNTTTGAVAYGGVPLKIARAVSDAAAGAMILISERTLHQLLPILPLLESSTFAAFGASRGAPGGPPMVIYSGDVGTEDLLGSTATATIAATSGGMTVAGVMALVRSASTTMTTAATAALGAPTAPSLLRTQSTTALAVSNAVITASAGGNASTAKDDQTRVSERTVALYQLVGFRLRQRLPHLEPLRGIRFVQLGNMEAPVGPDVAITFLTVPAAQALLADLGSTGRRVLAAVKAVLVGQCGQRGGYVIEAVEGLCLAAFHDPATAAAWALGCMETLQNMEWPAAVLNHPQCREVYDKTANRTLAVVPYDSPAMRSTAPIKAATGACTATATAANNGHQQQLHAPLPYTGGPTIDVNSSASAAARTATTAAVGGTGAVRHQPPRRSLLHRGPRLRAGIHVGEVACDVHSSTGRLSYRGRVMNRAARIAYKAEDGQVLCSRTAWTVVQNIMPCGSTLELERSSPQHQHQLPHTQQQQQPLQQRGSGGNMGSGSPGPAATAVGLGSPSGRSGHASGGSSLRWANSLRSLLPHAVGGSGAGAAGCSSLGTHHVNAQQPTMQYDNPSGADQQQQLQLSPLLAPPPSPSPAASTTHGSSSSPSPPPPPLLQPFRCHALKDEVCVSKPGSGDGVRGCGGCSICMDGGGGGSGSGRVLLAVSLGSFSLKGIAEPMELLQLRWGSCVS
ncbi:hypothetical protein Agub_g3784 [Astrephomene gubernaculifera]|uniref:Guanylate cyclase domain-containing protein n=1 Tax=Astrephomene gubernaculifera TaxID=47775 RepID=A0AAD3DL90_9CHLO|nr:hypothetical protein Agub_g3784 [Astrephomene gubernaculifera]